jgi:hypothetical protein
MELLANPDGKPIDRLQNLKPEILEHVNNEIMDRNLVVHLHDICKLLGITNDILDMI